MTVGANESKFLEAPSKIQALIASANKDLRERPFHLESATSLLLQLFSLGAIKYLTEFFASYFADVWE